MKSEIARFCLSRQEIDDIDGLLADLSRKFLHLEHPDLLQHIGSWAAELPRRLRFFCEEFRLSERSHGCIVSGYPVDDTGIGQSPVKSRRSHKPAAEIRLEFFIALLGVQFGDLFCWGAQHGGTLIHDLAPVPEHLGMQFGTGSQSELVWHTEDAFHDCRCDYIGLFCMRNPQEVGTTVGTLDSDALSQEHKRWLLSPSFTIHPDPSYLIGGEGTVPSAERVSVLYGHPDRPYLRLDPTYMEEPEDEEVRLALKHAVRLIEDSLTPVVVRAGELLILDNHRAVHGRTAFVAHFDGKDRWVKRVSMARDLKKSCKDRASYAEQHRLKRGNGQQVSPIQPALPI